MIQLKLTILVWGCLSANPSAIHLLENALANPVFDGNRMQTNKLCQYHLSANPAAIHILKKNPKKIYWPHLSRNPAAIHIIEKELTKKKNKIHWSNLSQNPAAIHIIKDALADPAKSNKIDWPNLSRNPNLFVKNDDWCDAFKKFN